MTFPSYVIPGQVICPVIEQDQELRRSYTAGVGVSLENDPVPRLVANVVGKVKLHSRQGLSLEDVEQIKEGTSKTLQFVVNIESKFVNSQQGSSAEDSVTRVSSSVLPDVGDVVYARISRISAQQAHAEIIVLESQADASQLGLDNMSSGPLNADSGVGAGPDQGVTGLPSMGSSVVTHQASDLGEGYGGIIRIQDIRATERDKVQVNKCFRPGDIVRAKVLSLGDGMNYYLSTAQNDLGVIFARGASGQLMYPVDWETMRCPVTDLEEPRKCAKPF